jgi:hypothetical protein
MFPPSRLWSLSHPGTKTTIDLTLTNTPERTIRCQIYHDNYGSDHRATYSEWDLQPEMRREQRPRRAYERTEWERVGEMILASMTLLPRVDSEAQLDQLVNDLIEATITAVEAHTPHVKPSPYSKRWFTADLKTQQAAVNKTRRKWQASCADRGREDPATMNLFREMAKNAENGPERLKKANPHTGRIFSTRPARRTFYGRQLNTQHPEIITPTSPHLWLGKRNILTTKIKPGRSWRISFPQ